MIDHDLKDALSRMSTVHLRALYRVAKTRARIFFRNPRAMKLLRNELAKRDA